MARRRRSGREPGSLAAGSVLLPSPEAASLPALSRAPLRDCELLVPQPFLSLWDGWVQSLRARCPFASQRAHSGHFWFLSGLR